MCISWVRVTVQGGGEVSKFLFWAGPVGAMQDHTCTDTKHLFLGDFPLQSWSKAMQKCKTAQWGGEGCSILA